MNLHPIFDALGRALLHFFWQGALLAVLLYLFNSAARRADARLRYAASCITMLLMLGSFVATIAVGLPHAPTPVIDNGLTSSLPLHPTKQAAGAAAAAALLPVKAATPALPDWLAALWLLGVASMSIYSLLGWIRVERLKRHTIEAVHPACLEPLIRRLGVTPAVRVCTTALAEVPAVIGWLRPVILLPVMALTGLSEPQLRAILAHELAHIRRHDYLVNLLQTAVETLLFYHPAVWWVSARMRHERELCCDDRAVESCGNALCYARALTRLERLRLVAPGMAMASTGGPLLYRIQRLMGVAGAEYRPSRWPAIVTVCVGLGCLALNVHWAKAQEQAQPAQTTVTVTTQGESKTVNVPLHFFAREASYRDRGVQIDTGGATVLKREPVEYPGPAIERNIQGVVTVEAIQDANGEVTDAHVLAGPQELRKAALQSVLEWRFQPAAAGTSRQVNITFQIPPGGFPKEPQEGQQFIVRGPNVAVAKKLTAERAEQTLAFLEDEVRVFKLQYQGQLEAGTSPEADAKFLDWKAKLDAAQLALKIAKEHAVVGEDSAAAVVGRTVRSINSRGLPEGRSAELLGRLQFHVGDTVTADSLEQFEGAVRQFDEQMVIGYTLTEGNQVEIHLVYTPGEGTVRVRK